MRLLIDEDLASRELLARLERILPGDVSRADYGTPDEGVWLRAQEVGAAVLRGNVIDFLRFVATGPDHHGLLLAYRTNDRVRDLRIADIASGVAAIIRDHPSGLDGLVLAVNDAVRRPTSI